MPRARAPDADCASRFDGITQKRFRNECGGVAGNTYAGFMRKKGACAGAENKLYPHAYGALPPGMARADAVYVGICFSRSCASATARTRPRPAYAARPRTPTGASWSTTAAG